MSNKNTVV